MVKFLNCKIDVSKKIFIPRPETEFWVKKAIEELKIENCKLKINILDIFAGSGCIGIAILKNIKNIQVDFVDLDPKALQQIEINLKLNKIQKNRCRIYKSDLFEKLKGKKYDFILANPPYVALKRISEVQPSVLKEEPHLALFAGKDGLDYVKRFLNEVKNYLNLVVKTGLFVKGEQKMKMSNFYCGVKPRGKFYLEFDPNQKSEIEKILRKENLKFEFKKDQFKKWRFLTGYKS